MKVLHVYRTYFPDPPGGLQEAIRQICLSTRDLGVENTVFTLSPEPEPAVIDMPEARVVRCRSWAAPASCDLGSLSAFKTFRQLAEEADIIHYLFPWPFADVLHHSLRIKKPSIMTYVSDVVRQQFLGRVYSPLMWSMLDKMEVIISNAPAYAESSTVLTTPSVAERVQIIPLGIDEQSYPLSGDERVFNRLKIDKAEPYFLFIGVLRYYKGLQSLIGAAEINGATVLIAGTGPEGTALKADVAKKDLTNVIFAGQVSDAEKISLLKYCRGFILPSNLRSEAFGMALVEAAMMSKAMISCEIGTGTSYINKHEETGIVVQPDSPNELAKAMNVLLDDREQAEKYGQAARERYETMFSSEVLGKAYVGVYEKVLGIS